MNKIGKVKFALLAAGALGGVLLLSGVALDMLSLCLTGLAVWLLVLMALSYGNRLKLHQCFAFAERGALLAAQNAEQIRLLAARNADLDTKLRVLGKSVSDGQHLYLRGYAGMDRQISELQVHSDRNIEMLRAESDAAFKDIWLALQVPVEGAPTNSYSESEAASDLVPCDADQSLLGDDALVPMRTRPLGVAFASLVGLISGESEKLLAEIGSTGGSLDHEIKALAKQANGENERLTAEIGSVANSLQQEIEALAKQANGENERLTAEIGSVGNSLQQEVKVLAQYCGDGNAVLLEQVGAVGNVIERELQALAKQRISDNASIGVELERELKALARQWQDGNAKTGEQIGVCQNGLQHIQSVIEDSCKSVADFIQDDERLRDVTRRGMQWVKYETVQEVESLMQLNKLFPETADISLLGGWAMDPAAMLAVLKMILENRPRVIVECGSGTSTVWIAYALKRLGGGKLISLDHSVEYADKTRSELKRLGLTEFADVRVGALEEVEINGAKFTWYSVSVLAGIDAVDMLLVDGPPGASGELARYPAVPLLASSLRPSAYVIVDDAKRPMEKKIMNRWRREFNELGNPFWVASRTAALIWDQTV